MLAAEFTGGSRIGPQSPLRMMELDWGTGEVLDAIKAASVQDNTIVIWASDNGGSGPGTACVEDTLDLQIWIAATTSPARAMLAWPA